MTEYAGIIIISILAACVSALFIILTSVLGPKGKLTAIKSAPFECGQDPIALPSGAFSVKFYILGMLFILFEIEVVFLYPWAVLYRSLGLFGFLEMTGFMAVLAGGFIFAWKKGALEIR